MPEMSPLVLITIACVIAWVVSLGFAYALCRAAARTSPVHQRLPRQDSARSSRADGVDTHR